MSILKAKKLWVSVGIVVGLVASFTLGSSGAKVTIGEEKVNYNQLVSKIDKKEKELDYTKDKVKKGIADEQKKLDEKKSDVTETLAMVQKKNELSAEIEKLGKDTESKKGEVSKLDGDINGKKAELEKLTEGVKTKQEEPKTLIAGEYIVGKDIPAGRYKATATGRGSNFFVYDKSGRAVVNTILGNSSVGRGDYVFFCEAGNIIKTGEQVKLIPVE
ncbi:hypothetical protein [Bacillus gaemokensis]|uniref:Uncharacterized protein n=1 Tax=Bacillus gaemokensis TaxID=574375 RepID=A0A073KBI0_9BACI|nr:hypothetical protein [Bacillus gaemokensis]KEK23866.1 hypothetical protein BAGA_05325 [Bacillus gaemokensis]KYG38106.1 hypothetical protein AZF08_20360 [Bacillus gaemokensis]